MLEGKIDDLCANEKLTSKELMGILKHSKPFLWVSLITFPSVEISGWLVGIPYM